MNESVVSTGKETLICLVPLAAAVFAVTTDAVLNRRPALALVKRADWSVMLLLCALFIWMQGFHNTHLVHFVWHETGLRDTSYGAMSVKTLAVFCVFVVLGNNFIGSVPVTLIVCDLLEPCAYQRGIVLYLAVLCTAGSNLTLYSSTANMIAVQRGIQVLKYRLPFLVHFQYGFLSSLILLPFGIMLIYGLLLLGVK
ncbi:hypothetical protein LSH36_570g07018 [Paralvinella palmiformis]|uniref:Citrate transporter-like domain-containing protein n=1 Tax=Paralvinella palmiformis TaxID=53620 RepID=A0AAD9MX83_9ANNE|nr:hypothetical protein LSH36_570g07018 [Paralvinella palmiformis]